MLLYLCSVAFAFICGAVGGALIYRNNVAKLQAKESEGRKLLDALKNPPRG
jgi:ABC-type antimicrobial peptide transport system permease subunit